MEALKFDTLVRKNGILKIPELENYVNQNVEVFVVIKSQKPIKSEEINISVFFEKWAGYFSEIKTDDIKYNYLIEKHK
jgi:CRISPR/Cas system CMR-associated protein Cmr3 (group 5 of RAMP superfamily)